MKILSRLSVRFLQLVALLLLCAIFSAPQAHAQAIKMLPPTNCTPVGTWHVLGWDAVNPLSCIPNFSFANNGYTGIGTAAGMPQALLELYGDDNFSYPTPGTTPLGNMHMYPTDNIDGYSEAITFGGEGGQGNNDEAGIYVQYSNAFGTKMYFGTTNNWGIGSQVHMMIDQNGNVGIGTVNPQGPLEVNGVIYFNGSPGFQSYISPDITQHTNSGFFQTSNATTATGWPENYGNWYHMLSTTHVNTGNYFSMQFASRFFDSDHLYFRETGNSGAAAWRQVITTASNGNVGIFTTAPSAPLDVVGGVRGSGATVVAGGGCSPEGMFGYDLTSHKPVYCNGAVWISLWSAPPTVTSMVLYANQTVGPYSFCAWSGGNAGNNFVQGIYPISGGPGAYMWSITVTTGPQRIDCF